MRGKAGGVTSTACPTGITPAYAGKRDEVLKMSYWDKDHPRLCGEKLSGNSSNVFLIGSPPPMRGKVINLTHTRF